MPKTVLLAGATGAVGRPLTSLLVARGYRVFGTTRSQERVAALRALGAEPLLLDALDAAAVAQAFVTAKPDAVLHQLTDLPPGLDPSLMADALVRNARIRTEGTRHLVDAALQAGTAHFIAQSVAWAYRPGGEPRTEDRPLDSEASGARATTVQGVLALEAAVLGSPPMRGCVLRYGQFYGLGTGSDNADGKAMPVHVQAAAWAALLALEAGASGAFNVAQANAHVATAKAREVLGWHDGMRL
jgi:nucleoside-diphosphate-sugar epimerase